ILSIGYSVSIK
ncbi:hypothetical protein D027_4229B, partial [Vibrio parahaemolyticus 861]